MNIITEDDLKEIVGLLVVLERHNSTPETVKSRLKVLHRKLNAEIEAT